MIKTNIKTSMTSPTSLSHFDEISSLYDVFIFDLWGVTHNGKKAFPGTLETLKELKKLSKPVYFLSNAPRRKAPAISQLIERGVPQNLYTDLFTSGEDCYEHLRDRPNAFYQSLGDKLYHIGPEKDKNLFATLPYQEVDLSQADFILNTGTYTFEDTMETFDDTLKEGLKLKLPMICANPDKVVLYGEDKALCAGAIADVYEKQGGVVTYHGKPSKHIFMKMFMKFKIHGARILMVGDSLGTDIKGANNTHIDSLFILSGIHQLQTPEEAFLLYKDYQAHPTYVMERVTW